MRPLPPSLRVVAYVFILAGWASVIGMLVGLFLGQFSINLGFLCLFIGKGLLGLRRGARTWALVFLWFSFIAIGLVGPLVLITGQSGVARVGRKIIGEIPAPYVFLLYGCLFAVSAWQYWVLTRPEIKELFGIRQYSPGFCQKCGYDLTGNVSGRCPERGEPV